METSNIKFTNEAEKYPEVYYIYALFNIQEKIWAIYFLKDKKFYRVITTYLTKQFEISQRINIKIIE